MASVFKKRNRKTGKLRPVWNFKYKDTAGKWRYGAGWPDKQKTLQHALEVEAESRAIRTGEKQARPSWLKNRNTPYSDVCVAYMAWGRTQGGRGGRAWDNLHADQKESILVWWGEQLELQSMQDFANLMVRVEKLAQSELARGLTKKTVSTKIEALRSLILWAVKRGYLEHNPLAGIGKLDTRPLEPHRTLNDDEVAALMKAAPPNRALWYRVCLETGFRVNEARMLRVKDLDRNAPALHLEADFSKDRKTHHQPITRALCVELDKLTVDRQPGDSLLQLSRRNASDHIITDFKKAGVQILTDDGRATWHSLRKVYINNLVKGGNDLKTIMTLARHSSAQLSMEVYAKADPALLRKAIEGAANKISDAVSVVSCCSGVAPDISGNVDITTSAEQTMSYEGESMVGATGIEPVTSWV